MIRGGAIRYPPRTRHTPPPGDLTVPMYRFIRFILEVLSISTRVRTSNVDGVRKRRAGDGGRRDDGRIVAPGRSEMCVRSGVVVVWL